MRFAVAEEGMSSSAVHQARAHGADVAAGVATPLACPAALLAAARLAKQLFVVFQRKISPLSRLCEEP
jgi:hypothetical protein